MRKKTLAIIALIMTCVMIIMSLPLQALAYELSKVFGESTYANTQTGISDIEDLSIEFEDTSKRNIAEKHYKMSDGSYIAVKYDKPVHYYHETDGWLDIDNTLEYNTSDGINGYVNKANSFEVKFAENTDEEVLFSINDTSGNYKITFEIVSPSNGTEAIVVDDIASYSNTTAETTLSTMTQLNNMTSEIVYSDIYDNIDIVYSVTPIGVKESIIVYERLDTYEFAFTVNAGDLSLSLNNDGGIDATANGIVFYTIPAPFMFDNNGKESSAVHYALCDNGNGIYTLKIVADTSWINSTETSFPVTIDPIVNTTTAGYTITDAYVSSESPDTYVNAATSMCVGKTSDGSIGRAFLDINGLPEIYDCDVITSAELYYYTEGTQETSPAYELHEITSEWDADTVTWNTQPTFGNKVIDSIKIESEDENNYVNWDITAHAKDYYKTGVFTGLAIVSSDENTVGNTVLTNAAHETNKPYILVKYRCQQGVEDHYTYTSYDDGQGGTAYVNNYTGTVTYIKNIFTSESDVMPAKLNIVYNSSMGDSIFSWSDRYINTCLYTGMQLSEGWKLSAQESVVPVEMLEEDLDTNEQTYAYIYNDEDGTEHYFYRDTETTEETVYIDENGLGMELRKDETNKQYIIKTPYGTTKTFKIISERRGSESFDNGYIISEADEDGNTITYTYDDTYKSQLVSISDPSGTVINIGYTNSNITSISAGGKTYTLEYNLGWNNWLTTLKSVTDESGRKVSFTYTDTYNGALTYINNDDASGLSFNYDYISYKEVSYKATTVSYRSGEGGGVGAAVYSYEMGYATTVQYLGDDCTVNTEDDMFITYTFDKAGNTKLMYAENSARDIVYATSMYGYSSGNTMNVTASDFKLTSYADTGIVGTNLIADSSAEGTSLVMNSSGGATVEKTSSESYIGNNSYSASTDTESTFGMSTAETLAQGKYTFSAYVKTAEGFGGNVFVKVLDANGNTLAVSSAINATVSELNGGWVRLSADFEITEAGEYILAVAANGAGKFYADALQLEVDTGYTPSAYNMLENSGFESGMANWTASSSTNVALNSESKFGNAGVTVNGSYGTDYTVLQRVAINCIPSNSYIISAWAKGEAVSTIEDDKSFDLIATVNYDYLDADGVLLTGTHTTAVPFTWETREWQYVSGVVEMPEMAEGETLYTIRSIDVGVRYNNCNTAQFDNIALVQDSALLIKYDNEGDLVNITVDNDSEYNYKYDDATGRLTHIYYKDGGLYRRYMYNDNGELECEYDENDELYKSYAYNENGDLVSVTDKDGNVEESYTYTDDSLTSSLVDGVTSNYGYTTWGTQCSQSVSMVIDQVTKTMSSSAAYDATTKKLISETDSLGNTVTYGYDANLWLNLIEDANGNQTRYTYTGTNLTSQFVDTDKDGICDEGEAVVSFTYDTYGKVTGITTATTEYEFTYNSANLPVTVGIKGETTPLITYLYNDKNTVNTGYTYANGLTISYEYDNIGSVLSVQKNNDIYLAFEYDANLQLIKECDFEADTVTEYFYSDSNELYLTRKTFGSDVILVYSITDDQSNETHSITEINGTKLTYTSIYDEEDKLSKYVLPNLDEITSETDEFDRTTAVYLKDSDGNILLSCTYGYTDKTVDGETKTSEYIASMTYSNGNTYEYTYDANGNITRYKEGSVVMEYHYDELGQLIREDNGHANRSWTYTYDTAGNILSKSEYNYSTSTLGACLDTITYTYSTGNWGDQLTSYDGEEIVYDALGNPVVWRDYEATWEGRTLTSYLGLDFTYNADGIRTSKDVGSYDIRYILDDNNTLVGEICTYEDSSHDYIYYYYDESGSPVSFSLNGEIYYYVKNQQGDVIEIIDEAGTVKAGYEYDAWGKVLNYYGDETIATLNPILYRGYYYDWETELYYLQSRYYDPEVGRFLNADSTDCLGITGAILGYNLYTYCQNSCVCYADYSGFAAVKLTFGFWDYVNDLPKFKKGTKIAGFTWDSKQNIWYSNKFCLQRGFGYCETYNRLAALAGCFINNHKIIFSYDNKDWVIWLWKGVYGITTGAEIGIYIYEKNSFIENTLGEPWYRCANKDEYLYMSFELYQCGKKLFSRSDTHWWLTGFKPRLINSRYKLTMQGKITFPSWAMARAFALAGGYRVPHYTSKTVSFIW